MAKRSRSKVLVFLDLLGTRSSNSNSIAQVQRRLNLFTQTVAEGINDAVSKYDVDLVSADFESDSAALRFVNLSDAVLAGMAVLHRAISKTYDGERDAELALRGVIVHLQDSHPLRRTVPLVGFPNVERVRLSSSFLQAIMLEKSGFKGSRLTFSPTLLSVENRNELQRKYSEAHGLNVVPWASLGAKFYSSDLTTWSDVLWPLHSPKTISATLKVLERRIQSHKGNVGAVENLKATLAVVSVSKVHLVNSAGT